MAYKQKNNPVPKTGCGRRRLSAMKNPFKSQDIMSDESMSVKERVAKAQGREVGEMNKSSRFHPDNEGRKVKTAFKFGLEDRGIDSAARGTKGIGPDGKPLKMKSPMKKISGPCKTAAKRKFKVWPSAYASGWGVRCTRAGGPGKMGKSKK